MKRFNRILLLSALVLSALSILGQPTHRVETSTDLKPGVVVEEVAKYSEAGKAGLKEGDVILRWARGEAVGEIQSPFDLSAAEIEQAPQGSLTVEGFSGNEKQAWSLGPSDWGIKARPNFSEPMLAMYRQSQELAKASQRVEAAEHWRSLAGQVSSSDSVWLSAWLLYHSAEMLTGARQWKEADSAYQEAVGKAPGIGPAISASLLRAWAKTFDLRSDWANAEKYYQQSIAESQKLSRESLLIAMNLASLGEMAGKRGNPAKAQEYHRQALEIRQKLAPESLPVASSLFNLGRVASDQGDLAKAEEYLQEALDTRRKLAPESLATADSFNGLGIIAWSQGDLARAAEYYRRALDIRQKLAPESLALASSFTNLGLIAYDQGDLARAEKYHLRALDIRQKLAPQGLDVSASLTNLGNVADVRGDLAKAEEYEHRALDIVQKLAPEGLDASAIVNNLGLTVCKRGDLAKGEEYVRQALDMRQKLAPGSLYVAQSLSNLGGIAKDQGDLARAEEYQRQALDIRQKLAPGSIFVAASLEMLGDAVSDRGNLPKAEEYYQQALIIWEKLARGSIGHSQTLAALARIALRKQQLDAAAELYQEALNVFESQTAQLGGSEEVRFGFRATHESYYKEYIDLLMIRKQPEIAFHIMERWRARTLLEMLATAHIDVHRGVDSVLLNQERSLQDLFRGKVNNRLRLLNGQHTERQIQTLDSEIAAVLRQYEDVEARIRTNSPSYAALTQPQPSNAQAVQRLLPDDTLLLEYSLGKTRSYVFAVTANSLNSYELPPSGEIEGKAQHLYQLWTERSRIVRTENDSQRRTRLRKADAESRRTAVELSKTVVGPVAAGLQHRRLLIVSDGALQYVPFAALPTPGLPPSQPPDPLIVQHEIVTLPSASVLAFLQQNHTADKEVAIFADPVFDNRDSRVKSDPAQLATLTKGEIQDWPGNKPLSPAAAQFNDALARSVADMNPGRNGELHLPRLAFTRDEANAILAVVPHGSGMEAIDFDASRKLAMSGELARYRVVHFATHALVDNIHPEFSGLVLSLVDQKGEPMDGFLGLQDIYNLDLSADLVVLSACQTALGKEINGEGMIGLTRGFMYAGASSVVATLWKVNDFATAKLMAHFYKAIERDGMTPAQALRHAQLALWNEQPLAAPYYWAGFILQGGWQ
jgi:CHAT domain-containing protein/tetratricopeptide (TPR) repeat protein